MVASLGLIAGLTFGVVKSTQRFFGLEKNDEEVRKYGALSNEEVIRLGGIPMNAELIDQYAFEPRK